MKFLTTIAAAALLTFGMATVADAGQLKTGTLLCSVDPNIGLVFGSQRTADCTFHSVDGRVSHYTAQIDRLGIDLGITAAQTIGWVVFSAGRNADDLSGTYVGGSAELSLGLGGNVNALVGGLNNSVALQPFSGGPQAGINLALGVTALTLEAN